MIENKKQWPPFWNGSKLCFHILWLLVWIKYYGWFLKKIGLGRTSLVTLRSCSPRTLPATLNPRNCFCGCNRLNVTVTLTLTLTLPHNLTITLTRAVHQNRPKWQKNYMRASVYIQFWRFFKNYFYLFIYLFMDFASNWNDSKVCISDPSSNRVYEYCQHESHDDLK